MPDTAAIILLLPATAGRERLFVACRLRFPPAHREAAHIVEWLSGPLRPDLAAIEAERAPDRLGVAAG